MRLFETGMYLSATSLLLLPATSVALLGPAGGRPVRYAAAGVRGPSSSVEGRAAPCMVAAEGASFGELDGTNVRVGIISTRWNKEIVTRLTDGVKEALKGCNVTDSNIFETQVPGAFELPLAARFLALSQTVDAVVCVGCLIKGETMHFEYIADATCNGLMDVSLLTSTPVILGVLTCLDEEQATKRSTGDNSHGIDWGKTAVEMALLRMSATGMGKSSSAALGFGKSLADKKKDIEEAVPGSTPKKIGF